METFAVPCNRRAHGARRSADREMAEDDHALNEGALDLHPTNLGLWKGPILSAAVNTRAFAFLRRRPSVSENKIHIHARSGTRIEVRGFGFLV